MRIEMVMPQMGESITEGTIVRWTKKVGDLVARDENVLDISTDKVDSEIPSPAAGRLVEIRAQEGETIPVGQVIAVIETEVGAASAAGPGGAGCRRSPPRRAPASAAPSAPAPACARLGPLRRRAAGSGVGSPAPASGAGSQLRLRRRSPARRRCLGPGADPVGPAARPAAPRPRRR